MLKLHVEGVCPLHIHWVGTQGAPTPPSTTYRTPGDSQAAIDSEMSSRCRERRFSQQMQSNGHMVVARKKKNMGSDIVAATWQSHATACWQLQVRQQTRRKWGRCPLLQRANCCNSKKTEVVTKYKQNVHFNGFQQRKPTERDDPPRSDALKD